MWLQKGLLFSVSLLTLCKGQLEIGVMSGSDVVLQCSLGDENAVPEWFGPPSASVTLTSGGNVTVDGYEYVDNKDLKILAVRTNQSGEYKCSVGGNESKMKLQVKSYDGQFEFPGSEMGVEDPSRQYFPAEVNKFFNFTCVVKNVSPKPVTVKVGLRNGSEVIDQGVESIDEQLEADKTYTVSVSSKINATADMEGAALFCQVNFPDGNVSTSGDVTVQLFWPPYLRAYQIGRQGPASRELMCDTSSRPPTTIVWLINGEEIVDVPGDNIEIQNTIVQEQNGMTVVKSNFTITNATKLDNNRTIECEYIYRNKSVGKNTIPLNIEFDPTNVTVSMPDMPITLTSDAVDVNVTCSTDSSKGYTLGTGNGSSIRFGWLVVLPYEKNRTVLTPKANYTIIDPGLYGGDITRKIGTVSLTGDMHGATVICTMLFFNADTAVESSGVVLDIYYPPKIVRPIMADYSTYLGQVFRLRCVVDSNPKSNVTWYYNNTVELVSVNDSNIEYSNNQALLQIVDIQNSDIGEYVCKATNGIGQEGSKAVMINAESKPEMPVVLAMPTRAADGTVMLTASLQTRPSTLFKYYVQYKEMNSTAWLEMAEPLPDSLNLEPGLSQAVNISGLEPSKEYDVRVRAVDGYGREIYTGIYQLQKQEEVPGEPMPQEETVSKTDYNNAILISVLVTAGAFIIIIIIIVIVLKKKPCSKSSKYEMS